MGKDKVGREIEFKTAAILINVIDVIKGGHVFCARLPNGCTGRFSFPQRVDLKCGSADLEMMLD